MIGGMMNRRNVHKAWNDAYLRYLGNRWGFTYIRHWPRIERCFSGRDADGLNKFRHLVSHLRRRPRIGIKAEYPAEWGEVQISSLHRGEW